MPSDIPQSVKDQTELTKANIDDWLKNDVFHAGWWILICLVVLTVIIWLVLLDKSRLKETVLFAALFFIIILATDEYGDELILWYYPVDIIPIFRTLTSYNLLLLPMAYSLVYQYFKTTRRFVFAALAVTAVICFAVEPLLSLGNLYRLLNWQYWWGFPFYFAAALLVRKITLKAFSISERSAEQRR
jgi:hypothetical protein